MLSDLATLTIFENTKERGTVEFGEPKELKIGFTEPYSVLLTPRKRERL